LAVLGPATIAALDSSLPAHWSHGNPVDVLGDASPERYADAVATVLRDPACDGLLAILAPQGMTDPTRVAQKLAAHSQQHPILIRASWMGGGAGAQGASLPREAGIPAFPFPDSAARAFVYLCQFSQSIRALYETPRVSAPGDGPVAGPVDGLDGGPDRRRAT